MARKASKIQDTSSDDDAPEVVSRTASKADAKRDQKARRDFEAEEKARKKAHNRTRDQKLKERARVTKGEQSGKGVRFVNPIVEEEEDEEEEDGEDQIRRDDVEARMLRAMRDAEGEIESEEEDGEFERMEEDMTSGSDASSVQDDDDAGVSGDSDSMDPEVAMDDEEMHEEPASRHSNIRRPSRKADYLPDDLFAAAFASKNSPSQPKEKAAPTQQAIKRRRRKLNAHPEDLVIGGRTIRTLPRLSDPHSQATARTVPSAHARKFLDQSLAMRGQAIVKVKKKGWERRAANVGVMKYQGAPHGFARSTRETS